MNKQDLIERIQTTFNGVPQPNKLTLFVAQAHDTYDYANDDHHRSKDFIGSWQDIPSKHLAQCQNALNYIDSVGMRFYLPAYMVWFLENYTNKTIETDFVLYAMDPQQSDVKLASYHKERFSLLTKSNCKLVQNLLNIACKIQPA
ncbi:MAG: DUF6714 family protein [Bdellovibrionota bacterium]